MLIRRRSPNHDKLKEFFVAASGFDGSGRNTENPEEDVRYWTTVLSSALGTKGEPDEREAVCAYLEAKMGDRFVDEDAVRKLWIDALAAHEKDAEAWKARMDRQFAHKPADLARGCGYYNVNRELRSEFYAKHGQPLFAALQTFAEKMRVPNELRRIGMNEEAIATARGISTNGLADEELAQLGAFVAMYQAEEEIVLPYYSRMKDQVAAAKARFDLYNGRSHRNAPFMEKALAEIPTLQKSPEHNTPDLVFAQARLLQGLGRFDEAVKAYRSANKQPDSEGGSSFQCSSEATWNPRRLSQRRLSSFHCSKMFFGIELANR